MDFSDLLRRLRFREDQLDFGILLAKSAQDGWQDFPGRTRHKCHPQRATQCRAGAARRCNRAFRLDHRSFAFLKKHPARQGQSRDPIGALDQQRSQFLLDLLDGDREGRLGHMQTIGGAAKTELFCNRNELSKLTQLDHALARRLSLPAERAGYRIEPKNTNEFSFADRRCDREDKSPHPALPRKREREFRRDAERPLSTNSGLNTLALLPLPLAGEVDALDRSAAGGGFHRAHRILMGAAWTPRR